MLPLLRIMMTELHRESRTTDREDGTNCNMFTYPSAAGADEVRIALFKSLMLQPKASGWAGNGRARISGKFAGRQN